MPIVFDKNHTFETQQWLTWELVNMAFICNLSQQYIKWVGWQSLMHTSTSLSKCCNCIYKLHHPSCYLCSNLMGLFVWKKEKSSIHSSKSSCSCCAWYMGRGWTANWKKEEYNFWMAVKLLLLHGDSSVMPSYPKNKSTLSMIYNSKPILRTSFCRYIFLNLD